MKVTATKTGFYGGSRRRPGETFEMEVSAKGKLPSWVTAGKAPAPPARPAVNGDTKPADAAAAARKKAVDPAGELA